MVLRSKGKESITIITLHGKITYQRTVLIPADPASKALLKQLYGKDRIYPMDEELGIDRFSFKMSYRFISAVSEISVTSQSYKDAAKRILLTYGEEISPRQIENITDFVGSIMFQKQCMEAEEQAKIAFDPSLKRNARRDVCYIMADGAMVHLRDRGKDIEKNIPGEDGWCESKHAICFAEKDVKLLGYDKEGKPRNSILRRDAIGYIGEHTEFQKHLLLLARRNDFERYSQQVIIIDGCTWLGKMMNKLFPCATIILDKYHVKENAGKFAIAVKSTTEERKQYADHLCDLIDQGDVDTLLVELEPYKGQKIDGALNFYTYVENHKKYMNYPLYESLGYFVGSGAMESGNKSLMQGRLKLIGMRWNRIRAQGVLVLRIYSVCGKWDEVEETLRVYR